MSPSKPLSYESLKTVLQHFEANKRFQLANCCPAIRKIEKIVPLKLDSLILSSDDKIKVNDTTYQLAAYRQYPPGAEVPPWHKDDISWDEPNLDKYGAPEKSKEKILAPGDILIEEPEGLEEWEMEDDEAIEDHLDSIERLESLPLPCWTERRWAELAWARAALVPYYNRRDNVLPEYKIMTKITIKPLGSEKRIEVFEKRCQIHEALKHLTTYLLGGRSCSVRVKHLSFGSDITILRLPVDLKLKVRELKLNQDLGHKLALFNPILDVTPLEVLETESLSNMVHPLERSANKLIIENLIDDNALVLLPKLPNPEIHLTALSKSDKFLQLFQKILENWMEYGREIGVSFTLAGFRISERFFMDELVKASEVFNGKRTGKRSIVIPLNFTSEVHLEYQVTSRHEAIRLTVVPISST